MDALVAKRKTHKDLFDDPAGPKVEFKVAETSGIPHFKIDFERDGNWDETWDVKDDGSIRRKVSATDTIFKLDGPEWVEKLDKK